MKIICTNSKHQLTEEELELLEKVNEFKIKLDEKHVIHIKDLLDRVVICLKDKQDRIKELPLSLDELKKQKQLLDEYLSCREYKDKADEKLKKRFDDLYEDLSDEWGKKCERNHDENLGEKIVGDWIKRTSKLVIAIEELLKKKEGYYDKTCLKGLFTPSAMTVTLFMENMSEQNRKEDVVFVYIHEMLHAYYYCCFDKHGKNVREIEECMAEFGALCFLEKLATQDGDPKDTFSDIFRDVFEHAKKQIEAKKFTIGDLAAYGFGKYVFDHCTNKEKWLLAYSKKSLLLDVNMSDVAEYVNRVFPFYPIKENECFKCLKRVLFDNNHPRYLFEHYQDFHDVALRILLIDDKVGGDVTNCPAQTPTYTDVTNDIKNSNQLAVKKCPSEDCGKKQCKLCTIKRLMDDSDKNDGKNLVFNGIGKVIDYFYWEEKDIECYCCPTVIGDFIDEDNNVLKDYTEIVLTDTINDSHSSLKNFFKKIFNCSSGTEESTMTIHGCFEPILDTSDNTNTTNTKRKSINKVQIVGVRDVRTALLLLSRYKFDMLFIDYLLDKKKGGNSESGREYSIQFFEFLSTDYDKKAKDEKVEEKKKKYQLLDKLRHAVLDNRGPLDKLWIMPITGFNSPFIQTLQNKNVPLISTRWHIENGADPITTPWQFLVKLNQFIELQLKGCVYNMEQLITFLTFSGANLKRAYPYKKDTYRRRKSHRNYNPLMPNCRFHEFQAFMGAEFSNFISHFGSRPVIRRDAMIEGEDITNKSVFSTYVWNKFYTGDDSNKNDKEALFSLHNLMQIFYQVAATMPEDRNGVLRLRESFRRLRYYIEKHDLYIQNETDSDKEKLDETLSFIADCIDVLLEEKPDRKEVETGK